MDIIIKSNILNDYNTALLDKLVLSVLIQTADENNVSSMRSTDIADMINYRPYSIYLSINRLVKLGYINRYGNNKNRKTKILGV